MLREGRRALEAYNTNGRPTWHLPLLGLCAYLQLAQPAEPRLPRAVRPRHYDLTLLYDIDPATNFSFFGNVDIQLLAEEPTPRIVLHAQDFTIDASHVRLYDRNLSTIDVDLVFENDILTVALGEPLQDGLEYTLSIPFSGHLEVGLDGAYISSYMNKQKRVKEYLITTQFQATSARKAFPCFDEPALKATFRISIGHPRDFSAITNMPAQRQFNVSALENVWPWKTIEKTLKKPEKDFIWDHFKTSVPMSTYLVAWVVSKFASVDSPTGIYDHPIRIWARADATDQLQYASQISQKVLTHLVEWFRVPFPLPKQDMVAIPDFAEGAMENWGLITYRESHLLYKEGETSMLFKENIAATIAHELAHQWFGNLVTMSWWSDLWLNEGFATYMGTLAVAAVEDSWSAEESHAVTTMFNVLQLDALESSHSVSSDIEDPNRINEIFDTISYEKGSLLVRMMIKFMGEKIFKQGITNYLRKYSYSNAEQDDLWQELTLVNAAHGGFPRNITIKTIMDTWTTQTGYPLLTINRNYSDKTLYITQKRFRILGSVEKSHPRWWVPLRLLGPREARSGWLAADEGGSEAKQLEHGATPGEWVLLNVDMIAPCRVNYDESNWRLLLQTLLSDQYSSIPALSRAQLLSDALALAWTNVLDYKLALELVTYLKRETDYFAIEAGLESLSPIEGLLKRSPHYGVFQEFVRSLITEAYERVKGMSSGKRTGNEKGTGDEKEIRDEDLKTLKLKVLVRRWACRVELQSCQEDAIDLFQRWMGASDPDEHNPIPLDFRTSVYCEALSRGSVREWDFLLARWRRSNVPSVADAIVPALACTRQVWLLTKYLGWTITPGSMVRPQDAAHVLVNVASSRVGYYVARGFIYNHIQELHDTFRGQGRYLGPVLQVLASQFTTDRELDEFLRWVNANQKYLAECDMALDQAQEDAEINVKWVKNYQTHVVEIIKALTAKEKAGNQFLDLTR